MNDDEEPCGDEFEVEPVDIIAWGQKEPIATREPITLRCSLPTGHQPDDIHSDGVTDWRD